MSRLSRYTTSVYTLEFQEMPSSSGKTVIIVFAYFLLISGIICGSSVGVATTFLPGETSFLKLCARWQLIFFWCLPFAIFEYFYYSTLMVEPLNEIYKVKSLGDVSLLFFSGVSLFLWNCGLIFAANNTV